MLTMFDSLAYAWRHLPEKIDPVFLRLGGFEIRYYGLMYLVGFAVVYFLVMYRLKSEPIGISKDTVQNFFTWVIIGILIGGRLGYVLIYDFAHYLRYPAQIFLPFTTERGFHYTGLAGMSYHGGLVGFALAAFLFCRFHKIDFWRFTDLFAPAVPLGYMFGRIGNFLNGELYGRPTEKPWGMFFPLDPSHTLRHPSQLYEAFFEGIILFSALWNLRNKNYGMGALTALYLCGYGIARFLIEFFREPDHQMGFAWGPFTMGQLLCLFMIAAGIWISTSLRGPRGAKGAVAGRSNLTEK